MEFIPINLAQLKMLYNGGESLRSLAKRFGTSKLTIKRKLIKAGVEVLSSVEYQKKNQTRFVKESAKRYEYEDVERYYEEGMSINEIVNKFNISEPKVRRLIKNRRCVDKGYINDRFTKIYEEVKPDWMNSSNLCDLYINQQWSITDIANHYGYDPEAIRCAFVKYGIKRRSATEATLLVNKKSGYQSCLEVAVKKILEDHGIEYKKAIYGGFEFDFLVDDKLLIEVNGLFYHLYCKNKAKRDDKKLKYWQDNLKDKYDYKILWEHYAESEGSLYDLLDGWINFDKLEIDKKELIFNKVEFQEADLFCRAYHYHRKTRKGSYYGAFYHGKLIAVSVFSPIVRKQSADRLGIEATKIRELSRFCINQSYKSKNLASFILSQFEKMFWYENEFVDVLLTFADQTMNHSGIIYKATNWKQDGETKESYYYTNGRMRWHKKTIWQHARYLKMAENEFVHLFGLKKVPTLKKYRFVKFRS